MRRLFAGVALSLATGPASAAPPVIRDPDTRAWWTITGELSSDAMEGRDTGSPGHARAARLVAGRFAAAGLKPAGANGYLQPIPLHEVKVETAGTSFRVVSDAAPPQTFEFLHQISLRPSDALPASISGRLAFRGYCGKAEVGEVTGRMVVCFGGRRATAPGAAERSAAAAAGGAVALIAVDDPGFTIEPARWPDAYARTVTIREPAAGPLSPSLRARQLPLRAIARREPLNPPLLGDPRVKPEGEVLPGFDPGMAAKRPEGVRNVASLAVMRLSSDVFAALIAGSGQDAAAILRAGAASRPLPSFDIPARFEARFATSRRDYTSENVLGLLPGTDPRLKAEVVVVSAHLDGYGFGEPVGGDALYNGAFDDAAYVATLVRLAEQPRGRGFRRSLLFAAFTGEEKGLLGATWFTRHPTVPKPALAADINLDQLRPLFPLKVLTMHALDDTTLGATARGVAAGMGVEIRPDREPERNLNQRADHWPFLKIGVPATGFVFGYDPGSEAERRYRQWYAVRYHRPQDDMTQPWDPQAAADFNSFFYRLTAAVADAEQRPALLPTSPLAPH